MADVEEGINCTEPDILTVFLLEGGTKAGGKDTGTGSFSNAQYTKNMAFKTDEPGSYILKSFNNNHPRTDYCSTKKHLQAASNPFIKKLGWEGKKEEKRER